MRRRYGGCLALLLTAGLLLGGCGSKGGTDSAQADSGRGEVYAMDSYGEDAAVQSAAGGASSSAAVTEENVEGSTESSTELSVNQKLIVTRNMSVETSSFDDFLQAVRDKTQELGGYLESTSVSGQPEKGDRNSYLVIRVPADKLEELTKVAEDGATVLSMDEYTSDVTLEYVDVESRLTALRTEQESLLKLMVQAEKLEDIIQLQTRLTDVNYEIDSYESRLRTMDNQVEYSTLYLDIREVERERAESGNKGFWAEVKDGLSNSFYGFGSGLRSFGVAFFVALPYLAALAVLVIAGAALIKKGKRRKQEKTKQAPDQDQGEEPRQEK